MEDKRFQLEQLARIEQAIVDRVSRSKQWLPPPYNSADAPVARKLSARQCALQRWEAGSLIRKYDSIKQANPVAVLPSVSKFEAELSACMDLSDTRPAEDLRAYYAQHRDGRGNDRFVSDATKHALNEYEHWSSPDEQWGRLLRLEPFYRAVLAAEEVTEKPVDYRDYLLQFEKYAEYGGPELARYLMEFYDRSYAVGPINIAIDLPAVRELMQKAAADPLYCETCTHKFANEALFKAHLSGRKHKRGVAQQLAAAEQATVEHATTIQPATAAIAAAASELIPVLAAALRGAVQSTIAEIDRKSGMTVQERKLEVEAIELEREREEAMLSGEESDSEVADPEPTRQLIGPEGTPLPRWLFKLHGLGTSFRCEICEPHAKVAGRLQFERHFRDHKHIQGLKRLGISVGMAEAFKGITTVPEALELQKALKSGSHQHARQNHPQFEAEVEDNDGNVMSEKMMADLKKQGLI